MSYPLVTGRPVENLPVAFAWQSGPWVAIFDQHVELIQQDILRALAADRLVVYLSCPISARGGSVAKTNVEIAEATARRLGEEWGQRFWFLNPGQYQLESKQGTGLIRRHAEWLRLTHQLDVDVDVLLRDSPPGGGDYMRMWTRVLAEDGGGNLGERFAAFYFIGPSDFRAFFTEGGRMSLDAGVESYVARKLAMDPDFAAELSSAGRDGGEHARKELLRYYTVRASAGFSRGSHDEWNIWRALNELRENHAALGVSGQIPGYFDGRQVDLGAASVPAQRGYALPVERPEVAPATRPEESGAPTPPTEATSATVAANALARHGLGSAPRRVPETGRAPTRGRDPMTKLVEAKGGPRVSPKRPEQVSAYVRAEYDKATETWGIPNNLSRTMGAHPGLALTEVDYANSFIFQESTFAEIPRPGAADAETTVLFPVAGFVDRVTKELVILLVSLLNRSRYSITHHSVIGFGTLARRVPSPSPEARAARAEQMLLHVVDDAGQPAFEDRMYEGAPLYTKLQLAALRLAATMNRDAHAVGDEQIAALRRLLADEARRAIAAGPLAAQFGARGPDEAYVAAYVDAMLVELTWLVAHFSGLLNRWFTVLRVREEDYPVTPAGQTFTEVYESVVPESIKARNNAVLGPGGFGDR